MKRFLQVVVGLTVGFLLLYLPFRHVAWDRVLSAIEDMSVWGLILAIVLITLTFFARVQRWSYIVRTAKWVSFRHMFNATQIGFFMNFLLPFRTGELVRAAVLSRLARLPVGKSLAMVALDRMTDLVGLAAVIVVTAFAYAPTGPVVRIPKETLGVEVAFPTSLIAKAEVFVIALLFVMAASLVVLYLNQALMLRISDRCLGWISKRFANWAHTFLQHFAEGLHVFRSASDMLKSIFFSLVTWGLFLSIIAILARAFHIDCPWYTPFVTELLVAGAISLPISPGLIGQFHLPIVIAFMMVVPGMDISKAVAFAWVLYLVNLIPVVVLGGISMFWEGFGLVELTRSGSAAKQAAKE